MLEIDKISNNIKTKQRTRNILKSSTVADSVCCCTFLCLVSWFASSALFSGSLSLAGGVTAPELIIWASCSSYPKASANSTANKWISRCSPSGAVFHVIAELQSIWLAKKKQKKKIHLPKWGIVSLDEEFIQDFIFTTRHFTSMLQKLVTSYSAQLVDNSDVTIGLYQLCTGEYCPAWTKLIKK